MRSTSDGVEGKPGLICLVFEAVGAVFRNFWYPLQWVGTKWRWLATQDHAKLIYAHALLGSP